MDKHLLARAGKIKLVAFDVDGVFTDGRLHYGANGEEQKIFHVRDGHGIKAVLAAGLQVAVISGRSSQIVSARMAELGVQHVFQGTSEKLPFFTALLDNLELDAGQAAFVGDDVPDLPVLRAAGLAIVVADAHPALTEAAHWRTALPGGHGAVREVCDLLLRARGLSTPTEAR